MNHLILCSYCSWSLWSFCFYSPFHNYNCRLGFYKFNLCMFFYWPLFCSINCNPLFNNLSILLFFPFLTLWSLLLVHFPFQLSSFVKCSNIHPQWAHEINYNQLMVPSPWFSLNFNEPNVPTKHETPLEWKLHLVPKYLCKHGLGN